MHTLLDLRGNIPSFVHVSPTGPLQPCWLDQQCTLTPLILIPFFPASRENTGNFDYFACWEQPALTFAQHRERGTKAPTGKRQRPPPLRPLPSASIGE